MKLVTRRLDEMTSREVAFYFASGGDTVFVPFGPVSGHGAFIPMGMHGHWAQALSVLLAERVNGLVYPVIHTVYSGATRAFRGSVSFPISEQVAILKRVAKVLHVQGFTRTILVAGTTPENYGGGVAARELFDETDVPFWMIEASRLLDLPEVKALWKGYPASFGETQLEMASLRILGRERPVPCAEWAREIKTDNGGDLPPDVHPDVTALRKLGTIGWYYYEEKNHGNHGTVGMEFKDGTDVDLAVRVLEKCADLLAPKLDSLERYAAWLEEHPFRYIVPTDRLDEE